jgi:hypothetical protein
MHRDRFEDGIPLPALALVLTCVSELRTTRISLNQLDSQVEHTIRHFGATKAPAFTAVQVEPYKNHLARFAEIDKIAAAKAAQPGASKPAQTPSQILALELLQLVR